MLQNLDGQVAWITGAGTGIGESAAIKLAEAGCKVVLSGRRRDVLENVAKAIGSGVSIKPLDVSNKDDVKGVTDMILEEHGRIDIGVFSAGINVRDRNWHNVAAEDWDRVINIDLNGAFYCCQAVLPTMRNQGGGLTVSYTHLTLPTNREV